MSEPRTNDALPDEWDELHQIANAPRGLRGAVPADAAPAPDASPEGPAVQQGETRSVMEAMLPAQQAMNAERARRLEAGEPLMTAAEIAEFLARRMAAERERAE